MNVRERVKAVINHRVADYVPCGLGGCETVDVPEIHLKAMLDAWKDNRFY